MTVRQKELLIGFIPAIIMPMLSITIFLYFDYEGSLPFFELIPELFNYKLFSAFLPVGVLPNLLFFMYTMRKERWNMGRGIVGATLLYGILLFC